MGQDLPKRVVRIPYRRLPSEGNAIKGTIAILDVQYGNIWTNIPAELFKNWDWHTAIKCGYRSIQQDRVYQGTMPYAATFGAVRKENRWLISIVYSSTLCAEHG